MRKKLTAVFTAFLLLFVQMGCGKADRVYLEKAEQDTEAVTSTGEAFLKSNNIASMVTGDTTAKQQDTSDTAEEENCYVYVCGAVEHPGVYVLKEGSRIYEAVALAGGLTEDAGLESVNQAEMVTDGQMVCILTKEEVAAGITVDSVGAAVTSDAENIQVNLNTASAAELMTLPGIGQSKADSIIAYRDIKGNFSRIEEIMNVEGIKEGVYNRIKDYIRVK